MNAISSTGETMDRARSIPPDLAHRWPQERGPILGQAWNDLLVWAHRREMSDLHVQTNRRVKIVVHGRFYDATRRAITHEEMTSLCVLLYGATALAHVVETRTGERYSIGAAGTPQAGAGDGLRSRAARHRATEANVGVHAPDHTPELGRPNHIRVA